MPKPEKVKMVEDLKSQLNQSEHIVFTDFKGLTVADMMELRKELRGVNAKYKVVKNNLFKLALKDTDFPSVDTFLVGNTGVVFIEGEAVEVLKKLVKYSKDKSLELKGGIIDKEVVSKDELVEMSKLPSRKELIAMVAGTISAPLTQFVGDLRAVISNFIYVLKALEDKLSNEEK